MKDFPSQEFEGQTYRIHQKSGTCCETGCSDCELFVHKVKSGLPLRKGSVIEIIRMIKTLGRKI